MAIARDGCVVVTAPLSAELQRFVASWNRERPPGSGGRFEGRGTRTDVSPVGAIRWLASETREKDMLGVGVPEKTIARVVAGRSRTTSLSIADAIVSALERPEWYHDGTITILPNPSAPRAARAACCGGSLTGAVDPT